MTLTRRKQIEVAGEKNELNDFYTALKSGTTVANFLERYDGIIRFIHKEGHVSALAHA